MIILFVCVFLILFIFAIVACSNLQTWNSSARMINADWMDASEKFKLIARWGA